MNLAVLRWLLAHRAVLTQVVEVAKKWDASSDMLAKWKLVDEIARLLLPVFQQEDVSVMSFDGGDMYGSYEMEEAFELGVQAQAMGIDWKQLIDVIIPIVIALLEALGRVR